MMMILKPSCGEQPPIQLGDASSLLTCTTIAIYLVLRPRQSETSDVLKVPPSDPGDQRASSGIAMAVQSYGASTKTFSHNNEELQRPNPFWPGARCGPRRVF